MYNIDDYKMPKIYIKLSVQDAEVRMSRSQVLLRRERERKRELKEIIREKDSTRYSCVRAVGSRCVVSLIKI